MTRFGDDVMMNAFVGPEASSSGSFGEMVCAFAKYLILDSVECPAEVFHFLERASDETFSAILVLEIIMFPGKFTSRLESERAFVSVKEIRFLFFQMLVIMKDCREIN